MLFHDKYRVATPWYRLITKEFRLDYDHSERTSVIGYEYEDDKVRIEKSGIVTMKKGFRWGASSFTLDTRATRRGTCVHDALFYLSWCGVFDGANSRKIMFLANEDMLRIFIEDKMWGRRARIWKKAVDARGETRWDVRRKP